MEVEFLEFIKVHKREKLSDDEKKQRHKESCKRYYEKNKEYLRNKNLQNYYKRKIKEHSSIFDASNPVFNEKDEKDENF